MTETPDLKARQRGWYARAQLFDPASAAVFDRIGVSAGQSCLDVGCGPGTTMKLLGDRVGKQGKVAGFDFDDVGAAGVEWLNETGVSRFEFIKGNVDEDFALAEQYDVVFGRAILIHAKDPVSVIDKMWAATKPGGTLLLQELDFGAVTAYPPIEWLDQWRAFLLGTFERLGRDGRVGRSLPTLFERSTAGAPQGTDVSGVIVRVSQLRPLMIAMLQRLMQVPLTDKPLTPEQSEALLARMQQNIEPEPFVSSQLCISAWKRKAA